MSVDIRMLMRLASLVLTVPVIFYSAAPFFRGAWRDIRLRRLGMDVPVALGIGVAFAASVYATFEAVGEVYFDSITMFVFFLLCGRYLEMRARQKAAARLEYLDRALPLAAHRLLHYPEVGYRGGAGGLVGSGRLVLVRPGEGFPADGVVVAGGDRDAMSHCSPARAVRSPRAWAWRSCRGSQPLESDRDAGRARRRSNARLRTFAA